MSKIEVTAKTVDEAVRSALIRLGISEDEADIEVIEEGAKGLFGIGGKEAKVIVSKKEVPASLTDSAKAFIDELIEKMNLDCQTEASESEGVINIVVSGKCPR